MEISTILLSFALPKWVFNCDAIGIIHIPLAMWSDKEHTRTSRSLDDDRVADLQIGDSEVRSAIYYHLVARWRAFQMEMDPSSSPLFGQILLRQFVSAHLLLLLENDLLSSYAHRLLLWPKGCDISCSKYQRSIGRSMSAISHRFQRPCGILRHIKSTNIAIKDLWASFTALSTETWSLWSSW